MRFINDDVKLKVGGRTAAPITDAALEELMLKTARRYTDELEDAVLPLEDMDLYYTAQNLHFNVVDKDNKFNVDGENVIVPGVDDEEDDELQDIGESLLGFHTLPNGLTFFGYLAGGDWEYPVFMIIYYDGKKLRGYTPSYGNVVNLDCKCAFGSDGCEMEDIPAFRKKYAKYTAWKEPNDVWDTQQILRDCYLEKYGIGPEDYIAFNYDAIRQDIEARIVVDTNVGTAVKSNKPKSTRKKPKSTGKKPKAKDNGTRTITSALLGMLILFSEFLDKCNKNPDKTVTLEFLLTNMQNSYLTKYPDGRCSITGFVPEQLNEMVDEEGYLKSADAEVIMAAYSEIMADFNITIK
ncbi:MAG: hypothetical protein IJZ68_06020 [Bacteroidaceae bacterium]|nr:hypothetical protein [Bacteroidaceae bacterium]